MTDHSFSRSDDAQRLLRVAERIFHGNVSGTLHIIRPPKEHKTTGCFKMVRDDGEADLFIKISEDPTTNTIKIAKRLFMRKTLANALAPYLVLPVFRKPQPVHVDGHKYDVVICPLIQHHTLEQLTHHAVHAGQINSAAYQSQMLRHCEKLVRANIELKRNGLAYMDTSPDNVIVPTGVANADCLMVDLESLVDWQDELEFISAPMKDAFKAPEVNSGEPFEVEKACVYSLGALFIFVLYGQLIKNCRDVSVISEQWLRSCIDPRPEYRLTFGQLLLAIQQHHQQLTRTSLAAQPAYVSSTQRVYNQLMQHFEGDSSLHSYSAVCALMTKDIDSYKRPWSQHMMDAYHQSGEDWHDYVEHTNLGMLRNGNIQHYSHLRSYQYAFSRAVYSPLFVFLNSNRHLFQGNADGLLRKIIDIYNHLKTRYVAPNCCLQVDVTSKHLLALNSDSVVESDDGSCDENEDELYQVQPNQQQSKPNVKQQQRKPQIRLLSDDDLHDSDEEQNVYDLDSQDMNMDQVLRDVIADLSRDVFSYKRYTLSVEGALVKGAEAATYNTVPDCAIENGPLCMLHNTVRTKSPSDDSITFSFQVHNDRINVYLLVSDDTGQVHGSRMFKHDLFETVPQLFADGIIDETLANEVFFNRDADYEKYFWDLHPPSHRTAQQNLSRFVTFWNAHSAHALDLERMTRCFVRHRIDESYFAQRDTRSRFTQLLKMECGVEDGPALNLWRYFVSACDESVRDKAVIRQYRRRVHAKDERIRELEAEISRLRLPH